MSIRVVLALTVCCLVWKGEITPVSAAPSDLVGEVKHLVNAPFAPDIHDVMGNAVPPSARRAKRQVTSCQTTPAQLTSAQQAECAGSHNNFRGQEQSANELIMVWNDTLAALAQAWANQCQWAHGNLYDCNGNQIGQNLYMNSGSAGYPPVNLTAVALAWDSEKAYWNFNTGACQSGQVCGHWSQMVWSSTSSVGCAYTSCPSVTVSPGNVWNNANIVVCNYNPPGNVQGQPIYTIGTPCSACTSVTGSLNYRGYKCQANLCVPCIPKNDTSCQCGPPLTCQNGGTFSNDYCVCQCPSGFYGLNCQNSCVCSDAMGSATCSQWLFYCSQPLYQAFMSSNCASTCGMCNLPPSCNSS